MVYQIDMSLDDIIKPNKTRGVVLHRGRNNSRRSTISRRDGRRFVRESAGPIRNVRRGGGIGKRPYFRSEMKRKWQFGMFDGFDAKKIGRLGFIGSLATSGQARLLVSNLDSGVSYSDIQERFAEFGPIKSAAVHYDRSRRSLGSADVIFEKQADAFKAMKQYNGVPLDGRAMNIQMVTSEIPAVGTEGRIGTGGFVQGRSQNGFGVVGRGGGARGARRGSGGERGQPRTFPTAEELDAELDAYMKNVK